MTTQWALRSGPKLSERLEVQAAQILGDRQEICVSSPFDFHKLIINIKVYAAEIASLVIFLKFLGKSVWREIKPLFRRPVHK